MSSSPSESNFSENEFKDEDYVRGLGPSLSSSDNSDNEITEENEIREDLKSMTLEEILALKKELGTKVYNEAVFGVDAKNTKRRKEPKRLNKNRPREQSSKRQVPFLTLDLEKSKNEIVVCDPRFDENAGTYDPTKFKQNYKFISEIREKEVAKLKEELKQPHNDNRKQEIKTAIQRLVNKNIEDKNWHARQAILKEEQLEVQKAHAEGRKPHYTTNKERRAKELVKKFEELKQNGRLTKHLEKRRKKNVAKDRKKINFD